MGNRHLSLVNAAKIAIDRVYSDTSADLETARKSLQELVGELKIKLESLEPQHQTPEN